MTKPRHRRSWTVEQKRTLAGEARRRRAAGESFKAITTDLGVLEGSLRLWMDQFPERTLQRVEVVAERHAAEEIALVTPDGFRFERLSIAVGIALWERLR